MQMYYFFVFAVLILAAPVVFARRESAGLSVVLGLLWAGLAAVRSLERAGLDVTGIAFDRSGSGSGRATSGGSVVAADDEAALAAIRSAAGDSRVVLLPGGTPTSPSWSFVVPERSSRWERSSSSWERWPAFGKGHQVGQGSVLAPSRPTPDSERVLATASSKPTGWTSGKSFVAVVSRTIVSFRCPSMSGLATERGHRGHEATPERRERRGEHRDGHDHGDTAALLPESLQHLPVRQHVGAADLQDRVMSVGGHVACPVQIGDHVVDRDRLRAGVHPPRSDHHRQSPHEVIEHPERRAPRPDHHAGPEFEHRWAVLREQPPGLVAAGQVRERSGSSSSPRPPR